jgi:hypothetical protein
MEIVTNGDRENLRPFYAPWPKIGNSVIIICPCSKSFLYARNVRQVTVIGRKRCVAMKQFTGTDSSVVIAASTFADTSYIFILAPFALSGRIYRTCKVRGMRS